MAILIKDQIKILIEDPNIKLVGTDYKLENLQSCSYDLRIGAIFKNGKIFSNDFNTGENFDIEVKPSEIITILTLEEVNLPLNLVGTVFAINGLSSTGFLILNPGHIDPGFKGPISICAINLSRHSIRLHYGKDIFTIIFDKLNSDAEQYTNKLYADRKLREADFYRNKAVKLSSSLFDLIKENEYTPYLRDLISTVIKEKMLSFIKWVSAILVTLATILGGIYLFWPANTNNEKQMQLKIDSLQMVIKKSKSDSVRRFVKNDLNLNNKTDSTLNKQKKHGN